MLNNKLFLVSNWWDDNHCYSTLVEALQNTDSKESRIYEISKANFCKENKFSLFFDFVQKNKKPFCFVVEYANPSKNEILVEGNELHLNKKTNKPLNYPFSKKWWIKDLFKRNNPDDCASNMFGSYMIDYIWIKEMIRNKTNWNKYVGVHPEDNTVDVIYRPNKKTKTGAYLDCAIYVLDKEINKKNRKFKIMNVTLTKKCFYCESINELQYEISKQTYSQEKEHIENNRYKSIILYMCNDCYKKI